MAPTCYLHIGGFKTGTSYLQRRLIDGRAALRASGVLVPGQHGIGEHVRAGKVILERTDLRGRPVPGAVWHRLRDEMLAFEGHSAVFSYEAVCGATTAQARRMVEDLAPAEVRIVITARDLVRVIPAAWQEVMQGGQEWAWQQFVDTITSRVGRVLPPGKTFWRHNDLVQVARRWAEVTGPEHVIVVTVPPSGAPPDVLWDRFCAAIGADPSVVPPDIGAVNESLDVAGAELLRRLNVLAAPTLAPHVYDREVKWFVAKEVLAARSGPDRVRLDKADTAWARTEGRQLADGLRALGVRVQGDLDDLIGDATEHQLTPEPADDQMLAAALDVIHGLVRRLGERGPEAERERARAAEQPGASAADPTARPAAGLRARKLAGRLLRDTYDRTRR